MGAGIRTTSRARDAGTVERASAAGTAGRPDGPRLARPRVLLATLLAAGALAACSAGPGPDSPTSPPASPGSVVTIPRTPATAGDTTPTSGTPTGYDVLANMPAAAKEHTSAGAQAFARYYIEAVGRLLMDPTKGQLPKLYLPECEECQGQEANTAKTHDRSIRWKDMYYRTLDVTQPKADGKTVDSALMPDDVTMELYLTTVPVMVQQGSAPPTSRSKGHDVLVKFRLSWRDGQWYVADFRSSVATSAPR